MQCQFLYSEDESKVKTVTCKQRQQIERSYKFEIIEKNTWQAQFKQDCMSSYISNHAQLFAYCNDSFRNGQLTSRFATH